MCCRPPCSALIGERGQTRHTRPVTEERAGVWLPAPLLDQVHAVEHEVLGVVQPVNESVGDGLVDATMPSVLALPASGPRPKPEPRWDRHGPRSRPCGFQLGLGIVGFDGIDT